MARKSYETGAGQPRVQIADRPICAATPNAGPNVMIGCQANCSQCFREIAEFMFFGGAEITWQTSSDLPASGLSSSMGYMRQKKAVNYGLKSFLANNH